MFRAQGKSGHMKQMNAVFNSIELPGFDGPTIQALREHLRDRLRESPNGAMSVCRDFEGRIVVSRYQNRFLANGGSIVTSAASNHHLLYVESH